LNRRSPSSSTPGRDCEKYNGDWDHLHCTSPKGGNPRRNRLADYPNPSQDIKRDKGHTLSISSPTVGGTSAQIRLTQNVCSCILLAQMNE
jgi:hypothetical protein